MPRQFPDAQDQAGDYRDPEQLLRSMLHPFLLLRDGSPKFLAHLPNLSFHRFHRILHCAGSVLRFPELIRTLTVPGLDMLFVVSQWPAARVFHLRSLTTARAIENQMFVCCCNSCGKAGPTQYGGNSAIIDPWGETIALAGEKEEILTADCDLKILENIRGSIPVFRDRRPQLYKI